MTTDSDAATDDTDCPPTTTSRTRIVMHTLLLPVYLTIVFLYLSVGRASRALTALKQATI